MSGTQPRVFISYNWTSKEYQRAVVDLAERLVKDGIDVVIDVWDLRPGQDLYQFMERCVTDETINKVLILCDRKYAQKADGREGGAGNETAVITPEIYGKVAQDKFIPVVMERDEGGEPYLPAYLRSRMYFDLSDGMRGGLYEDLLRSIFDRPRWPKPSLGSLPSWLYSDAAVQTADARSTRYMNPGSNNFRMAVESEIYVDKTRVISYLNTVIDTVQRYVSVSRPRRFGKTMTADMLCAYYGRGTDARGLFEGMKLAKDGQPSKGGLPWDAYLGKFDVIRVTMTDFLGAEGPVVERLRRMEELVSAEVRMAHPNAAFLDRPSLPMDMQSVFSADGTRFVVVIDEWDAPMRERRDDEEGQRVYLDFLRNWLKDKEWLALAYITGILPIKKYGMHSALNMFSEYSMVSPKSLAEFTGFTAEEVQEICDQRRLSFDAMCEWYDGYRLTDAPSPELVLDYDPEKDSRAYRVFNPLSVVSAARYRRLESYWSHTETYEALEEYIRMDFDGLREAVALLMDGGRVSANLGTYQNDMKSFRSRDDVLALLVHLGYLGWDADAGEAFIPNREVRQVFQDSTRTAEWDLAFREFERSKELVKATWDMDESRVADLLEAAHDQADNKGYNSEAALSFAVQMAYYAAHKWYTKLLELDSGKGYADIAYLSAPRHPEKPALIIELKHGKSPQEALDQIRDRNYLGRLGHYAGNALLVGISYDPGAKAGSPEFKRHHCKIERA